MAGAFSPFSAFRAFDGALRARSASITSQIAALFASGEQGVWYDIAPAYCFQDAAGTTPAVVGQPVGLVLDRSRGLVLGPELVTNGDFSNGATGWTLTTGWAISGGVASVDTGASLNAYLLQPVTNLVIGRTYQVSYSYDVVSGRVRLNAGLLGITPTRGAGSVGTDTVLVVATSNTHGILVEAVAVGTVATIDNISVRELPGNHAYQTTATSRPILRQNGATGAYYLEFDGSDDWLSTAAIDFTGTDKVTVVAGVRKLSTILGIVVEFSSSYDANPGAFSFFPDAGTLSIRRSSIFVSRGSGSTSISYGDDLRVPPWSAVQTGIGDIAGDLSIVRRDGVELMRATTDQGSGNYGNYPLYIGRRGGTTYPFNGHLYGLLVRGAASNDSQIKIVERYLAQKTGVTLA